MDLKTPHKLTPETKEEYIKFVEKLVSAELPDPVSTL